MARFREGDGLMSMGKEAVGYPLYMKEILNLLKSRNGFLPLFEFLPQKGLFTLATQDLNHTVKAHVLHDREVVGDARALWHQRLIRAVEERNVRLLYVRLSPALSWADNAAFLDGVNRSLIASGYTLGAPAPARGWTNLSVAGTQRRLWLAVLIGIAAPVLGLWLVLSWPVVPVVLRFLVFCLISTAAGVVIHSLGATELLVWGILPVRGVKAQLIAPLLAGVLLLARKEEVVRWWETEVKFKHIFGAGALLVAVVALYLMRSGNFPLIPVSHAERASRDALETFFGARPRLKEFLIGHPLLITGLTVLDRKPWARILILAGLIGQISIVNTFMHFHIPLEIGLLRTFHGIWIGLLVSVPFCYLSRR
jgi:hypothetical protein